MNHKSLFWKWFCLRDCSNSTYFCWISQIKRNFMVTKEKRMKTTTTTTKTNPQTKPKPTQNNPNIYFLFARFRVGQKLCILIRRNQIGFKITTQQFKAKRDFDVDKTSFGSARILILESRGCNSELSWCCSTYGLVFLSRGTSCSSPALSGELPPTCDHIRCDPQQARLGNSEWFI